MSVNPEEKSLKKLAHRRYGSWDYGGGYGYSSNRADKDPFRNSISARINMKGYDPQTITFEQCLDVFKAEGFVTDEFVYILANGTECPAYL